MKTGTSTAWFLRTTSAPSDKWSILGNWDNGLPAANDVVFAVADATGTITWPRDPDAVASFKGRSRTP